MNTVLLKKMHEQSINQSDHLWDLIKVRGDDPDPNGQLDVLEKRLNVMGMYLQALRIEAGKK